MDEWRVNRFPSVDQSEDRFKKSTISICCEIFWSTSVRYGFRIPTVDKTGG
jgi:hypothetical protein